MSFRPTIAVYIDGHIIDIQYCRNWFPEHLLYEAARLAALYGDCRSADEYLDSRYGCRELVYDVDPVTFRNTEEDLKFLESCSELPVIVDLTAQQIYCGFRALSSEELAAVPSALEAEDEYGYPIKWSPDSDFCHLLETYRIPFGQIDRQTLLELLEEDAA